MKSPPSGIFRSFFFITHKLNHEKVIITISMNNNINVDLATQGSQRN